MTYISLPSACGSFTQSLLEACKAGSEKIVLELLVGGVDANQADEVRGTKYNYYI